MILIAVDPCTNGISGRRYKSVKEALLDFKSEPWQPWDEARIKRAFNFGNGTMKDFKKCCKDNRMTVITLDEFHNIVGDRYDDWISGVLKG